MRSSVYAILIVAAYFVILTDAQTSSKLTPDVQTERRVCQGTRSTLSFNCQTNGSSIAFYAPPIINENQPFNVFSYENTRDCTTEENMAFSCNLNLFTSDDNTTFTATLFLVVTPNLPSQEYTVFCSASGAQGQNISTTTFTVVGEESRTQPSPAQASDLNNVSESVCSQVEFNLWWSPMNNIERYIVNMNGIAHTTIQNSMVVSIPRDNCIAEYSYSIQAISVCGSSEIRSGTLNLLNLTVCRPLPPPAPKGCDIVCILIIVCAVLATATIILITIVVTLIMSIKLQKWHWLKKVSETDENDHELHEKNDDKR